MKAEEHNKRLLAEISRGLMTEEQANSYYFKWMTDHFAQTNQHESDVVDAGGSLRLPSIDELLEKMNKIRNDEAFKGVLSFDYPNEILEVIDALEKLR